MSSVPETQPRGKLIVLEGPDTSGKTTQAKRLVDTLVCRDQVDIVYAREPGGTPLGENIRSILTTHQDADVLATMLLFFAARAELLAKVIGPHLARGTHVVMDRFYPSTYAYQGIVQSVPVEHIDALCAMVVTVVPDLTLVLDITPEVSGWREDSGMDLTSTGSDTYQENWFKIREFYRTSPKIVNRLLVDGNRPVDEIAKHILELVTPMVRPVSD